MSSTAEPDTAGDNIHRDADLDIDTEDGARVDRLFERQQAGALALRTSNAAERIPTPLALYVHAADNALIDTVLSRTSAGGSCVNQTMMHFLHGRLPFGGVNHSGNGNGHHGYLAFSHKRSILRDRFSLAFLFRPPYHAFTRWFIRFAVRWLS